MRRPVIVVHGGAGGFGPELTERAGEYREALAGALMAGADALKDSGDAVRAAVMAMEEFPLFNAGYGSALCEDGSVGLSASAMRGSDRARRARRADRGEPADAFAAACGLEQRDPSQFVTAQAPAPERAPGGGRRNGRRGVPGPGRIARRRDLDRRAPGPAVVAQGVALEAAGRRVLDAVADCGGSGGLIAVDADGQVSWPFSTDAMPRGRLRLGEAPAVETP